MRLLLASEGRPFAPGVLAAAAALAGPQRAAFGVLSIARIWGSSLGFPNPWLLPSKREIEAQRASVAAAVAALAAQGFAAEGRVVGTRDAARRIVREAAHGGYDAIIMGADPSRPRLLGELFWSQEPQRVQRRAKLPVHLVPVAAAGRAG